MAKSKGGMNHIGSWAFLIGVVLAVIFGIVGSTSQTIVLILAVIGLIVGLLNIAEDESQPFLISGAVLIIASALGQGAVSAVPALARILGALLLIFVPATIIVALRNVFSLARR